MNAAAARLQILLALRYLSGRKLRTFLTTLAVIIGVMIIFGMNSIIPVFINSIRVNTLAAAGKADLVITPQTSGSFDAAALEIVRSTGGVAAAEGSLRRSVSLPAANAPKMKGGARIQSLVVVGADPADAALVQPAALVSGRGLLPTDTQSMVISGTLAEQTGLKIGDRVRLPSADGVMVFEIVGIQAERAIPGVIQVTIPLSAAQSLFNLPGQINTIECLFAPNANAEEARARVLDRLGPGFQAGGGDPAGSFLATVKIGEIAFNLFGVLALIMGAFIIFNTFRTIVAERRRDIGMLRAIGASRGTILGMILTESLLQGGIGALLGLLGGYALVSLTLLLVRPFMVNYLHAPLVRPVFTPQNFALSIGLGLGTTILAGLIPAFSASRVTPLDALRPLPDGPTALARRGRTIAGMILIALSSASLAGGKIELAMPGAVLFLGGLTLVGPALIGPAARLLGRLVRLAFAREGQLAQGNVTRQSTRAAITASTMMIGLAVLVGMLGMMSSISIAITNYVERTLGADFLVMPQSIFLSSGNVGAGPALAGQIRALPGIKEVSSLRMAASKAKGADVQVIGIDPASYPRVSGLEFKEGDPAQAYAALAGGPSAIVNGIFASMNHLHVGDRLPVLTPQGERDYRVVGIGMDFINAKISTIYISQARLSAEFHESSDLLLMANMGKGANPAAVRAGLEKILADYPAFSVYASREWRDSQLKALDSAIALIYVLMASLALPALIALLNTLAINVLERTREIGVLRAIGATRSQVRRMILAEGLLLAAFGTACGILAGIWLSYILVEALNAGGFVLEYAFPAGGILLGIAVGLLFGVIAALIPASRAARMGIVRALRYE